VQADIQVIVDSINRTDLDLRKSLFSNIVLSGGSTLCTGFGDRLLNEVKKLALKDVKLKIYAPPERKVSQIIAATCVDQMLILQYSTWIGGSILAGLSTFKKVRQTLSDSRCRVSRRRLEPELTC
jgi:centractin